ncbi:dienelactone hydrolase family protein [Gilvimarinus sp. SDUM040013]|uniref:Dienelactone hydrolase family protein n=1 Tax=Gilvimarinus gilvus TaxID=3058038 RepID=A0ABU4RVZ7_9GAMM|nr:dienelactone hydrolase family protein [Gilvimarinus sp. SDUM040013]MDO3387357.1 dienelactone hydrolase family protein [Gilvimarinus sp. SDUM040013]MDX6849046.1 dienelactone hydrolase family protein [Gilvimarinus sp. SDUM040013]
MSNPFENLECLTLENPKAGASDACVIWLHGLGASCNDFANLLPELALSAGAKIRFIFPQAPTMPVTVNGGYEMPAWYDLLSLDVDRKFNEEHLRQASAAISEIVAQQVAQGIASERILIAGFSQGGAVAYDVALNSNHKLAGLMALSTYFATSATCTFAEANKHLPISIQHGLQDEVVVPELAKRAQELLRGRGYSVESHRYPMAHEVCFEQIQGISDFINRCLPAL